MSNYCHFCGTYGVRNFRDKIDRESAKKEGLELLYHDWSVLILEREWNRERGRKKAGHTIYYKNKHLGYQLNFCPECGKSLKGGTNESN